jgi:RNA polymerase sigma-70 factor (ECF subfamily)
VTGEDHITPHPSAAEAEIQELVTRCGRGDDAAHERLYRLLAPRIFGHLRLLLGDCAEVEDALQQTFLYAFTNLASFRGESRFATWLHGIAVRSALNVIRARGRRARALTRWTHALGFGRTPSDLSPERDLLVREDLRRLDTYLGELSADKQVAFLLYYVEDLDLGEVAERVGAAPAAVLKRIKRARTALVGRLAATSSTAGGLHD